jgi:hypothetical protein
MRISWQILKPEEEGETLIRQSDTRLLVEFGSIGSRLPIIVAMEQGDEPGVEELAEIVVSIWNNV